MAVCRSIFASGFTFNEGIGPRGTRYAMGSETELIRRLYQSGKQAVFLPNSLVEHIIHQDQVSPTWVVGRAFRQGRGDIRLRGEVSWFHTARLTKHAVCSSAAYWRI